MVTKTVLSKVIYKIDEIIPSVKVYTTFTGTPTIQLTCNGGTNWETITITSGTIKTHTFAYTGSVVQYKIQGSTPTVVTKFKIYT